MKYSTVVSDGPAAGSTSLAEPSLEMFYVVHSKGLGERDHRLCSALYGTRPQAETELARLRDSDLGSNYSVWRSTRYVERAEWLHRVLRLDGTLILSRLHGVEKYAEPRTP